MQDELKAKQNLNVLNASENQNIGIYIGRFFIIYFKIILVNITSNTESI